MSVTEPSQRPASRTLGGLLEEFAHNAPDRPAVLYQGAKITYSEFWSATVAAAKGLLAAGVRRGDRVGVLLGNQPEWLSMCFGAASIGAVFVPLNTWYKKQELEWTIRHSGLRALVVTPQFLKSDYVATFRELIPEIRHDELSELDCKRFPLLDTFAFTGAEADGPRWDDVLAQGASVPDQRFRQAAEAVSADDLAFILYTSGSTSEPKGVQLRHAGIIENGFDIGARRLITAEDRVWLGGPLFYGLGACNAMPATFTHGAALVLQDYFEAGRAIETIHTTRATVFYGPGAGNITQAILEHPSFSRSKVATLEKGNAGMIAEYKRRTIVDMGIRFATGSYGMTETYGNATGNMPDDPLEVKLHTNGTALPGFELKIVDPESRRPLGAGEQGLLLLRGHVTPGYFGNHQEQVQLFDVDGFLNTGDLGHLDSAGRFVFHSRLKEVIKSGGINVSPLEIEQLLAQHPSIRNAYVVGVPHPTRGEVAVAFVESRGALSEDEVKEFARERMSSFKVPHHVLFRSDGQLPRLASGKVSKHRLVEEAMRVV